MTSRASSFVLAGLGALALACTEPDPVAPHARVSDLVAQRDSFSVFTYLCSQDSKDLSIDGDVLHWSFVNTRRVVSSTPGLSGTLVAPISVNINLRNGAGDFHGTFVWSPEGYDGTWTSNFAGHFQGAKLEGDPLTLVSSHVIAQGTGVFAEQKLMFDILFNTAFDHPDAPEGCVWDGEHYIGTILTP